MDLKSYVNVFRKMQLFYKNVASQKSTRGRHKLLSVPIKFSKLR